MSSGRPTAEPLAQLEGQTIASQFLPRVTYQVGKRVGRGAMAVAFYAMRSAPDGQCPVVIKALQPDFVRQYGHAATLTIQKEAVALGRLNERVPSTPFVVRLLDTGASPIVDDFGPLDIPWIAVEYVHGGAEGTTLTDRVRHCVEDTGYAFPSHRAARAVECLCEGLAAVHEVGVIHRDLKPGNVLCCGSGDDEIFKVADFGVARPQGLAGTFFRDVVGTPGYVAPEAFGSRAPSCGAWTDVFGLAGVVYFLLTGQKFLQVKDAASMLVAMGTGVRRSVLDSPMLADDLRRRESCCRALDRIFAASTALDPKDRPQTTRAFAAAVLPWLTREPSSQWRPVQRQEPRSVRMSVTGADPWSWVCRQRASDDLIIRMGAWDVDGRCLASTNRGLMFWNGTAWQPIGQRAPDGDVRLVHRVAPSRWLVVSGASTLTTFSVDGVLDVVDLADRVKKIELVDGDLGDLAVMVDRRANGTFCLRAMSGWRWVRPVDLSTLRAVASVARVGDAQWLVAGRDANDAGVVALYSPLDFTFEYLPTRTVRAFVSCAGRDSLGIGLASGADGAILWWERGESRLETVDAHVDVSVVAVDPSGNGWAAGAGRVWYRSSRRSGDWLCVWKDDTWTAPFVSLFADAGRVIGITADGAILEGRVPVSELDTQRGGQNSQHDIVVVH